MHLGVEGGRGRSLGLMFCANQNGLRVKEVVIKHLPWLDHYMVSDRLAGICCHCRGEGLLEKPFLGDLWIRMDS